MLTCKQFLISWLGWNVRGALIALYTLPQTVKQSDQRISKPKIGPQTLSSTASTVLLPFFMVKVWVKDVRAGDGVRMVQFVASVCLGFFAVPLSWTTSNDELYHLHLFLSQGSSASTFACRAHVQTKTWDLRYELTLHQSAVFQPENLELLQPPSIVWHWFTSVDNASVVQYFTTSQRLNIDPHIFMSHIISSSIKIQPHLSSAICSSNFNLRKMLNVLTESNNLIKEHLHFQMTQITLSCVMHLELCIPCLCLSIGKLGSVLYKERY